MRIILIFSLFFFQGEKFTLTNERHCVNSISLKYVKGETPLKPVEADGSGGNEQMEEEAVCGKL